MMTPNDDLHADDANTQPDPMPPAQPDPIPPALPTPPPETVPPTGSKAPGGHVEDPTKPPDVPSKDVDPRADANWHCLFTAILTGMFAHHARQRHDKDVVEQAMAAADEAVMMLHKPKKDEAAAAAPDDKEPPLDVTAPETPDEDRLPDEPVKSEPPTKTDDVPPAGVKPSL